MSSINETRFVSATTPSSEDLATGDSKLYGSFRGRDVFFTQSGSQEDAWTGEFGQGGGSGEEPEETQTGASTAQDLAKLKRAQARARVRMAATLPDFQDETELQGFGFLLRRMMRDKDYSSLREEAEKFFPDVSLRHAAIATAVRMLKENPGGDEELQKELEQFLKDLEKGQSSAIRAGYHVSKRADEEAMGREELRQKLRDFYRQFIFLVRNPADLYAFILDQYPEEALQRNRQQEAKS